MEMDENGPKIQEAIKTNNSQALISILHELINQYQQKQWGEHPEPIKITDMSMKDISVVQSKDSKERENIEIANKHLDKFYAHYPKSRLQSTPAYQRAQEQYKNDPPEQRETKASLAASLSPDVRRELKQTLPETEYRALSADLQSSAQSLGVHYDIDVEEYHNPNHLARAEEAIAHSAPEGSKASVDGHERRFRRITKVKKNLFFMDFHYNTYGFNILPAIIWSQMHLIALETEQTKLHRNHVE